MAVCDIKSSVQKKTFYNIIQSLFSVLFCELLQKAELKKKEMPRILCHCCLVVQDFNLQQINIFL